MENLKINRNEVFDIMKGMSILLVVFGHTYNPITHKFIYLFHVAVFFIISGYFFNPSYLDSKKGVFTLFVKRVKSLWIPYVSYNFCALILQNIFLRIGFLTTNVESYKALNCYLQDGCATYVTMKSAFVYILKSFCFMNSRPFAGGLWFLGGLFLVTFFYSFVQIILKKLKIEKFHIVFSLSFLILGFVFEILKMPAKFKLFKQIDIVLISEIMFALGVLIKNYKFVELLKKVKLSIKIIIAFCSVVILILCSKVGTISIAGRNIIDPIFYILVSILGFVLIYYCSLGFTKIFYLKKIFTYLGEHTIPILALHTIAFKLVTFIQYKLYGVDFIVLSAYPVWKNSFAWSLLYVFVGLVIPLLFTYPFSKIKIVKKIFIL